MALVDLCCLARCCRLAELEVPAQLLERIETFRSSDGGFAPVTGQERGTIYACFMATGAIEDLGGDSSPAKLLNCVDSLRVKGGGYANDGLSTIVTTPATSAALVLKSSFGLPADDEAAAWLEKRVCEEGGFAATAMAPVPDLLSTAVSLHAFGCCGRGLQDEKAARCLEYVMSLARPDGGFAGSTDDPDTDVEYTFYGLLAAGHLEGGDG